MTYKKVLAAVDTTDDAGQVISAACEIANSNDSAISIVTVVRPLAYYFANSYTLVGEATSQELESQAVEQANALVSDLAERHGIDASAVNVTVGTPASEIRNLAQEIGADLIVIGTHGRHGLGLMLGSTANAVLHGTRCDVLAVKVRVEEPRQDRGK